MVTVMLGYVFWTDGKIPQTSDTAVKLATSAGTVVGQLGFGWLADVLGRKHVYGFELIFVIWATLAQALVGQSPGMEITGILTFWRVLMGIGIGTAKGGGDIDYDANSKTQVVTTLFLRLLPQSKAFTILSTQYTNLRSKIRIYEMARGNDGRRLRHAGLWPACRRTHGPHCHGSIFQPDQSRQCRCAMWSCMPSGNRQDVEDSYWIWRCTGMYRVILSTYNAGDAKIRV